MTPIRGSCASVQSAGGIGNSSRYGRACSHQVGRGEASGLRPAVPHDVGLRRRLGLGGGDGRYRGRRFHEGGCWDASGVRAGLAVLALLPLSGVWRWRSAMRFRSRVGGGSFC